MARKMYCTVWGGEEGDCELEELDSYEVAATIFAPMQLPQNDPGHSRMVFGVLI